jgi:hypothetical protein
MVMGGSQTSIRRQRTGIGWLVDKWLAYCQGKQCAVTTKGSDDR